MGNLLMGGLLPDKLYHCWDYSRSRGGIRIMAKTAFQAVQDLHPDAEVVWSHGSSAYGQAVYVVTRLDPSGGVSSQFSVTVREVSDDSKKT